MEQVYKQLKMISSSGIFKVICCNGSYLRLFRKKFWNAIWIKLVIFKWTPSFKCHPAISFPPSHYPNKSPRQLIELKKFWNKFLNFTLDLLEFSEFDNKWKNECKEI